MLELGRLIATRAVNEKLSIEQMRGLVKRHSRMDWGNIDPHDSKLNDLAVKTSIGRVLSCYDIEDNQRVWIITEALESIETVTTILFPEEY